jgi:dUTP pyrophosphatase
MNWQGAVLSMDKLKIMLDADPPLVEGLLSRETQLQPAGIDITLESVARYTGKGVIGVQNEIRQIPSVDLIPFDDDGFVFLPPGGYRIVFRETFHMPLTVVAMGLTRSSLLRSGAAIHCGLWDPGYHGIPSSLLVVSNPHGIRIEREARVLQVVFIALKSPPSSGYQGVYQYEGLSRKRLSAA